MEPSSRPRELIIEWTTFVDSLPDDRPVYICHTRADVASWITGSLTPRGEHWETTNLQTYQWPPNVKRRAWLAHIARSILSGEEVLDFNDPRQPHRAAEYVADLRRRVVAALDAE